MSVEGPIIKVLWDIIKRIMRWIKSKQDMFQARMLLSKAIRELLTEKPNLIRVETRIGQAELLLNNRPDEDLAIARAMLDDVKKYNMSHLAAHKVEATITQEFNELLRQYKIDVVPEWFTNPTKLQRLLLKELQRLLKEDIESLEALNDSPSEEQLKADVHSRGLRSLKMLIEARFIDEPYVGRFVVKEVVDEELDTFFIDKLEIGTFPDLKDDDLRTIASAIVNWATLCTTWCSFPFYLSKHPCPECHEVTPNLCPECPELKDCLRTHADYYVMLATILLEISYDRKEVNWVKERATARAQQWVAGIEPYRHLFGS